MKDLYIAEKPSVEGGRVTFSARLVDVGAALDRPTVVVKKDGAVVGNYQTGSFTFSESIGNARKVAYTVEVLNNYDVEPLYLPIWQEEQPLSTCPGLPRWKSAEDWVLSLSPTMIIC